MMRNVPVVSAKAKTGPMLTLFIGKTELMQLYHPDVAGKSQSSTTMNGHPNNKIGIRGLAE
jgi:hypothetical protein